MFHHLLGTSRVKVVLKFGKWNVPADMSEPVRENCKKLVKYRDESWTPGIIVASGDIPNMVPPGCDYVIVYERYYGPLTPQEEIPHVSPKCECGAGHTSFPGIHSYWCPAHPDNA